MVDNTKEQFYLYISQALECSLPTPEQSQLCFDVLLLWNYGLGDLEFLRAEFKSSLGSTKYERFDKGLKEAILRGCKYPGY
jgi:hypothetical protein